MRKARNWCTNLWVACLINSSCYWKKPSLSNTKIVLTSDKSTKIIQIILASLFLNNRKKYITEEWMEIKNTVKVLKSILLTILSTKVYFRWAAKMVCFKWSNQQKSISESCSMINIKVEVNFSLMSPSTMATSPKDYDTAKASSFFHRLD